VAISKSIRERVYNKFEGHCAYCGKAIEYKQMQIDHYYPQCKERFYAKRFKIDVHAEENLMPTCRRCNHYKRAASPGQFKKLMKTLHERLEKIYILNVAVNFGMATIKPFDGLFYFERLKQLPAPKQPATEAMSQSDVQ
jgi:5-methylcytosine-specific restriction endonuclease McrA